MLPDPFEHFYAHLPWILQLPIYIFLNIVLIRGIIGNKIMSEIEQRGVLEHRIVTSMSKHIDRWTSIARKAAIVQHYRLHAQGAGHDSDNILDCGQGRCAIL